MNPSLNRDRARRLAEDLLYECEDRGATPGYEYGVICQILRFARDNAHVAADCRCAFAHHPHPDVRAACALICEILEATDV